MADFLNTAGAYGVPVLTGAAAGYLFYRVIGCRTGACPITGNPWISTLYGALIGLLIGPH